MLHYFSVVSSDDNSWSGAAIIKCNVGNGLAVLSGVHPEFPVNQFDKSKYSSELLSVLQEYENTRKSIMSVLINILL